MINEILNIIYLLLPGYFANMSPVFFKKMNFLNYPTDFNKKLNGKRILGENKTFRGIFFGVLVSIPIAYLQKLINLENTIINYDNFILIGFLLGFGALFGDLIKSFFKRRLNISPGKPFIPFDQVDHVVFSLLFLSLFYKINFNVFAIAVLTTFPLHMIINYIGYKLKLRDTYY